MQYSSPSVSVAEPMFTSFLNLVIASMPLATISLKKISLSEYSHFLIIGIMFSLEIFMLPSFMLNLRVITLLYINTDVKS